MQRTGRCLCGAVTYTARGLESEIAACHCSMCRRWSGGPLLAISCTSVDWAGDEAIRTHASSEWAERGFCSQCGSSLFYRITAPGKLNGHLSLAVGTLDDQSGLTLAKEWFIDCKPAAYTFEGERLRLTEAEVFAMFTGGGD